MLPPFILPLLSFLRKYWLYIIVIIAIVAGALYVRHLYVKVGEQEAQIATLQSQLSECAVANQAYKSTLDAQNEAINKLSAISQKQLDAFNKLPSVISSKQKETTTKIEGILKGYKPVSCEDAIRYLIQAPKEFRK